jgi:hypothetical protein
VTNIVVCKICSDHSFVLAPWFAITRMNRTIFYSKNVVSNFSNATNSNSSCRREVLMALLNLIVILFICKVI